MQDIYTNSPASDIEKVPEPFKTAIQTSQQWKWERDEKMETTGCLTFIFPKNQLHDIGVTTSCANERAWHLIDMFGSQLSDGLNRIEPPLTATE